MKKLLILKGKFYLSFFHFLLFSLYPPSYLSSFFNSRIKMQIEEKNGWVDVKRVFFRHSSVSSRDVIIVYRHYAGASKEITCLMFTVFCYLSTCNALAYRIQTRHQHNGRFYAWRHPKPKKRFCNFFSWPPWFYSDSCLHVRLYFLFLHVVYTTLHHASNTEIGIEINSRLKAPNFLCYEKSCLHVQWGFFFLRDLNVMI